MVISFASTSANLLQHFLRDVEASLLRFGVCCQFVFVSEDDDFVEACARLECAKKASAESKAPCVVISCGCLLTCQNKGMTNAEVCALYDELFVVTEDKTTLNEKDTAFLRALLCHPHTRLLSFDEATKISQRIRDELQRTVPLEIENKYLVAMPTEEDFFGIPTSRTDDILQTYLLRKNENIQRRVRKRGNMIDGYTYTYTEKSKVIDGAREENERIIDEKIYESLLTEADTRLVPIEKRRRCFVYHGQFFEMDTYMFDDTKAIVELELEQVGQAVDFPPFLHLLADVTGDKRYKNTHLAKAQAFPKDI